MTVLRRVTRWVTSRVVLLMLIKQAIAVNSTTESTTVITTRELAADHVLEQSVQLKHVEASGSDDVITGDITSLAVLSHMEPLKTNIRKRAADYYNGVVGAQFYAPFNISSPRFPPGAVIGLSRPLQRGNSPPHVEFVAQW
ncbi:hypothetical protein RB195_005917 [Necator americanus]